MQEKNWIEYLTYGDYEQLWHSLFALVSKHPSVKGLYGYTRVSSAQLTDAYADFTQELFLKLFEKGRWQFYLDSGYEDCVVEHELSHFEVPNLVGLILRERYPEAFRISRRVINLLRSSKNYRQYHLGPSGENGARKAPRGLGKQVYGLSIWPADKPMKNPAHYADLVREIPSRRRDTRRVGRSSTSQVIISKVEMDQLILDIFTAIDSPLEVRSLRSLVLSKLMVEDSSFTSLDASVAAAQSAEYAQMKMELADNRPTPEEIVVMKDSSRHIEQVATELLERLEAAVNYKERRYEKILRVAWHCYFDQSAPSQRSIAAELGMSDSLVCYYRKIFDEMVKGLNLTEDEWILLNASLKDQVARALDRLDRVEQAPAMVRAKVCAVTA